MLFLSLQKAKTYVTNYLYYEKTFDVLDEPWVSKFHGNVSELSPNY